MLKGKEEEVNPVTLIAEQLEDIIEVTGRLVGSGFACQFSEHDFERYLEVCVGSFRTYMEMHQCYMEDERDMERQEFFDGVEQARRNLRESLARNQDLC